MFNRITAFLGEKKNGAFVGLFAGILLLGFVLRMNGYAWGEPHRLHPDEWKYVYNAVRVADGEWDTKYYKNPTGFTYTLAAVYKIALLGTPYPSAASGYKAHPFDFYAMARVWVALLGTLTLPLLYGISRKFLPRRDSLVAMSLLAVAFLPVRDAHFAVNDIPLTFFVTAALLGMLRTPTVKTILAAGLLSGLSIGVKYNAIPLLLPLFLMPVLAWEKKTPLYVFLAAVSAFTGFCIAVPGFLFSHAIFMSDFNTLIDVTQNPVGYSESISIPMAMLSTLIHGVGIIPTLLAVAGIIVIMQNNVKKAAIPVVFLAAFLGTILTGKLYFSRFLLPLFPVLCLFAAVGVQEILRRRKAVSLMVVVAGMLLCAESLTRSVWLNGLTMKDDTRVTALQQAQTHASKGYRIVADPLALPYIHHGSNLTLPREIAIVDFNKIPADQFYQWFEVADVLYVSEFAMNAVGLNQPNQEWKNTLGPKKNTIASSRSERGPGMTEDEVSTPLQSLFFRTRTGPTIYVYGSRE
jgi:hypothetical protein